MRHLVDYLADGESATTVSDLSGKDIGRQVKINDLEGILYSIQHRAHEQPIVIVQDGMRLDMRKVNPSTKVELCIPVSSESTM